MQQVTWWRGKWNTNLMELQLHFVWVMHMLLFLIHCGMVAERERPDSVLCLGGLFVLWVKGEHMTSGHFVCVSQAAEARRLLGWFFFFSLNEKSFVSLRTLPQYEKVRKSSYLHNCIKLLSRVRPQELLYDDIDTLSTGFPWFCMLHQAAIEAKSCQYHWVAANKQSLLRGRVHPGCSLSQVYTKTNIHSQSLLGLI